jgi:hypothetical protein
VITLATRDIAITIDPGYGADITSMVSHGHELLYQTSWREHAQRAIDDPGARTQSDDKAGWLERYRGGWQLLCPVAGGGGKLGHGRPTLFHGEASRVPWLLESSSGTHATLRVDLQTTPLSVSRSVQVDGDCVTVIDTVTNTGIAAVSFDYAHHLALGGDLLNGECTIESGASTFVRDWDYLGSPKTETDLPWPPVADPRIDVVPARPASRFEFGWLSGFESTWARVSNPALGITALIEWSDTLPYAWLWQELDASPNWPWLARERVLGLEPSSTPTSGPRRESSTRLAPSGSITIRMTVRAEAIDSDPSV